MGFFKKSDFKLWGEVCVDRIAKELGLSERPPFRLEEGEGTLLCVTYIEVPFPRPATITIETYEGGLGQFPSVGEIHYSTGLRTSVREKIWFQRPKFCSSSAIVEALNANENLVERVRKFANSVERIDGRKLTLETSFEIVPEEGGTVLEALVLPTATGILGMGESLKAADFFAIADLLEYYLVSPEDIRSGANTSMWQCRTCSELVENDFDVCWNCQNPKGSNLMGSE